MKTELTKRMERALLSYSPVSIAGQKLNKFRKNTIVFECVAECGTTSGGIVDCIRVDEIISNITKTGLCFLAHGRESHLKNGESPDTIKPESVCQKPLKELPEKCDCAKCAWSYVREDGDNDILITCYEIKVTKSDFHSSHGHNFVGNANFYVMPKDLYVEGELPRLIEVGASCFVHRCTDY